MLTELTNKLTNRIPVITTPQKMHIIASEVLHRMF
jgi:hypothetical protein